MVESSGLGQQARRLDGREKKERKKEGREVVRDTTFEGGKKINLRF
jgi:hypothetical protein